MLLPRPSVHEDNDVMKACLMRILNSETDTYKWYVLSYHLRYILAPPPLFQTFIDLLHLQARKDVHMLSRPARFKLIE